MTAPQKRFRNTFEGDQLVWYIRRESADEFSNTLGRELSSDPRILQAVFPFFGNNGSGGKVGVRANHDIVRYLPRTHSFDPQTLFSLSKILENRSAFVKPIGAPWFFERQEEYRFLLDVHMVGLKANPSIPEFWDLPFEPFSRFVEFID
ncbi:hypothetical protein [Chachezhania antarctica]|uniref:hypothetical protein n=1 Tax=Chachezhania antarctica TaxID=2340860 RepID=UPI0013CEFBD6|nr:hypothetical protein [Chachezhania antarctica]